MASLLDITDRIRISKDVLPGVLKAGAEIVNLLYLAETDANRALQKDCTVTPVHRKTLPFPVSASHQPLF